MKKIIALAVASAVSASAFADMTISGSVSAGYATDSKIYSTPNDLAEAEEVCETQGVTATGCTTPGKSGKGTGGFGVDGAGIVISGSETLENGLTFSGSISAGGFKRGASVGGENANLTVSGGFGSFAISEVESGNGVFGYGTGSVTEDFTGELVGAASNYTSVKYTAPAMGIATVSISGTETVGYGLGEDSTFAPGVNVALALSESVSAWVNYRPEKDAVAARTRVGGSFSANGLTIKAAMGMNDNAANETNTAIGASYVMGATTFGVGYGKSDTDLVVATGTATEDTPATNDTGMSYGFKHALSSNVAVAGKYTTYDNGTTDETKTNLTMSLAF